jgi:hypothetical protein
MARADILVERILREYPKTRSNDRLLIMGVWWAQDANYKDDFTNFFLNKAIMPETITRCRRKLQEQGKYEASQEVSEQRYNKFTQMRGYGSTSTDAIGRTL